MFRTTALRLLALVLPLTMVFSADVFSKQASHEGQGQEAYMAWAPQGNTVGIGRYIAGANYSPYTLEIQALINGEIVATAHMDPMTSINVQVPNHISMVGVTVGLHSILYTFFGIMITFDTMLTSPFCIEVVI